jgi:SWI/SNF-related matrix-associated actin-dependent regulator 1 of chromatin subfamily A
MGALLASLAQDSEAVIPAPSGLDYLPFQKAGVAFMLARKNTLLADDMGLGKTIQVIGFLNCHPEIRSVLIVCPKSVKLNWQLELETWLTREMNIGIVEPRNFPSADVLIINYALLAKYDFLLKLGTWDLLVCDEAHLLKTTTSRRTCCVVGGVTGKKWSKKRESFKPFKARYKAFLTGTPVENRPAELWPVIHYLDPETWDNERAYLIRHCGGYWDGREFVAKGATNLEGLQVALRSTIMCRRMKVDVLEELPEKIIQVIEIDEAPRAIQIHATRTIEQMATLEITEDIFDEEISTERKNCGIRKLKSSIAYIKETLEKVDKVVLFGWTGEVLDALAEEFDAALIKGETSEKDRAKAIDDFQNGSKRVFVGNLQAAGVGITLTAASTLIIVESDWIPGRVEQAIDRIYRIGQEKVVHIIILILRGSLDAYMARAFVKKQRIIEQTVNATTLKALPKRKTTRKEKAR